MVRSQTKPKSSKEAASKDKDKEKDKTKAKKPDGKDAKGAKAKPGKQAAEPRKAKALDPARTALIAKGKEKGFLTYEEVNDAMPEDVIRTDQIDSWMSMFSEHGIDIVDASAREFRIEEADVEAGVVRDDLRAVDEFEELRRDLGEARLVEQELVGDAGDRARALVDLAIGVQVGMEFAPGAPALHQLDATDLDHAVAALDFEAGGFGVEDDLAHRGLGIESRGLRVEDCGIAGKRLDETSGGTRTSPCAATRRPQPSALSSRTRSAA